MANLQALLERAAAEETLEASVEDEAKEIAAADNIEPVAEAVEPEAEEAEAVKLEEEDYKIMLQSI